MKNALGDGEGLGCGDGEGRPGFFEHCGYPVHQPNPYGNRFKRWKPSLVLGGLSIKVTAVC